MNKEQLARLDAIGVEAVLREISQGMHGQPTSQLREEVEAWLRSKQAAADEAAALKRDAREEKTLRIAIWANVIAAIAAITAIAAIVIAKS